MKKKIGAALVILVILAMSVTPVGRGITNTNERQQHHSNTGDVIYSPTPDWISGTPDYSTGAALADINQDDWLDLIISNGNDMSRGRVRVYLNDGHGHLPTEASWQSSDIAYNGHLDVADINGDGWPDVAVSYLGTGSSYGPIARVYMNIHGVLSCSPNWSSTIIGNAFGVDFGDMNNDGRPDLAIATGNPYSSAAYHTYVYLNINGSYGSTPSWQSDDQHMNLGCLWVDADNDGWLDLATIGSVHQTEIYRNLGGVLETSASWHTTDSANQFGIMLTAGDVTGDGKRDLFATDNTQLGGNGYFKQYTGLPGGFFSTTSSWSYYDGYGSAVELADINGDHRLDLATGAWWDNTRLFLNQGTGLPLVPSWNSSQSTVVEKIVFGNVGPTKNDRVRTQTFPGNGVQRLFYLPHRAIQYINQVKVDGVNLTPSEYTSSRDQGWLTVSRAPTSSLEVVYTFSYSLDMVISNWDNTLGNYLYYNKLLFPDLVTEGGLNWTNVSPGETLYGDFTVQNNGDPHSSLDWKVNATPSWGSWTVTPSSGQNLTPENGATTVHVTLVAPTSGGPIYQGEVVVVNQHDPDDVGRVPVWLNMGHSTPKFNVSSLKGPFGISVTFENSGNVTATQVNWSITVEGGMFHGVHKESHAIIPAMNPGQETTVRLKPFFGFGKIQGTFMLRCAEGVETHVSFSGRQFLFFTSVHIIPCNMTSQG